MYRVRRRRALLAAVVPLGLVYIVFGVVSPPFSGAARVSGGSDRAGVAVQHRAGGTVARWLAQGQAALVLGSERPTASPSEMPVPIASLAKVMTAYLTLERYPLGAGQEGFTVTITAAEVRAEAEDVSESQSGVAVRAGERLTERQLLEALLIPSGNNIADLLATVVAGSETRFVAEKNARPRTLGMNHTTYTDPSGCDTSTVSTAADQLRVFLQGMRFAAFRQIVAMPTVTLPVAGTVTNFDPLIAYGYAGKTGSDTAAGGRLAFFTGLTVGGRPETAAGVVMGQGQGSDTQSLLFAAGQAAEQLVNSVASKGVNTNASTTAPSGRGEVAAGHDRHPLPTAFRQHSLDVRQDLRPQERT